MLECRLLLLKLLPGKKSWVALVSTLFTEGNSWGDDVRHARLPGRGALGCDLIPVVVVVAMVPGRKEEELMQLCTMGFFVCPSVVAHGKPQCDEENEDNDNCRDASSE